MSLDDGSRGPGSHSLKMRSEGSTGDDYGVVLSPRFPLVPGYDYEMSIRYRAEGLTPNALARAGISALTLDLSMEGAGGRIGGARIQTSTNSKTWVSLGLLANFTTQFKVLPGANWGVVRVQLTDKIRNAPVTVWVDDVSVEPIDPILPNGGLEAAGDDGLPQGWRPFGGARTSWGEENAHAGRHSVSVSDAPGGELSGWSAIVPVRSARAYAFQGYVKGGAMNPNGFVRGGALALQFLDKDGQPLGEPQISQAVGPNTDWTLVATPKARPPAGAALARLTAGMSFVNGTAWFDDLSLSVDVAEVGAVARMRPREVKPSEGVRYAANLLVNGDVETGDNGAPLGWTYVGRSAPDWTDDEVKRFQSQGRPDFSIGRGQGEWSHDTVYAGKSALLNVSIDPPLSSGLQWHGRNPVDGFWLSAPAPCRPGARYVAGAWLKPGRRLSGMWLGPLEVRFYDAMGRQLDPATPMRSGTSQLPAGKWSYFATWPYVAPRNAVTLRLRFGQELAANAGGWGRTYGDNFAVWELPPNVREPDRSMAGDDFAFRAWFEQATSEIKPPYLASPTEAPAYENVWGNLNNSVPGNLYWDPNSGAVATFSIFNLLGEDRSVSLRVTRYDAWGNADFATTAGAISLKGSSATQVRVPLPPTGKFGAYYLDGDILDGDALVGKANGRYAVMPPSLSSADRGVARPAGKGAAPVWENPFGVTILAPVSGNGSPYERELGELLKTAGFGIAWVRLYYDPTPAKILEKIGSLKRQLAYYHGLGLRTVVQLMPNVVRPVSPQLYEAAGRLIGSQLKDLAAAVGDWGIEQANSWSPYRSGGKDRWTDDEYDAILAAQYDGLKSAAPDLPVLIGNIATDLEAKTIRRLYGPPASGKFDGCIMNAYGAQLEVANNAFAEFDAHGDKGKTIWWEEQANQRSPFEGPARRYGEIAGAEEMVKTWATMWGELSPHLKAVTMWGFVNSSEEDIMMVTPSLQPRPQYVAHAVMAHALEGASDPENLSTSDISLFKWQRPDGDLLVAWAKAGERDLAVAASSGALTVTDVMGNSRVEKAPGGNVTLKLTTSPIFLTGGGNVAINHSGD